MSDVQQVGGTQAVSTNLVTFRLSVNQFSDKALCGTAHNPFESLPVMASAGQNSHISHFIFKPTKRCFRGGTGSLLSPRPRSRADVRAVCSIVQTSAA